MFPRRGKIDPETLAGWKAEQVRLREALRVEPMRHLPRRVAGADCAFLGNDILAAAVLWDVPTQKIVAEATVRQATTVPYIPGYLGFRETPAVLAALRQLPAFDAVLCDGHGYAHPRRCGLAVHIGVALDVPTVGVAKSRLVGEHDDPGPESGDRTPLRHRDEQIGTVLRTRGGVKPLFISVGHRVTLARGCDVVMRCRTQFRLPEPTRRADRAVAAFKREQVQNLP